MAIRMRHDGVDVKLDVWDLKEGQDKYAYMEQCVTNPEIDKVLIFSDKWYCINKLILMYAREIQKVSVLH